MAGARIVEDDRMALIRCDFFAESIDQGTSVTVVLPQAEGGVAEPPPVLYLLHGLGDNDTAWTRFTSIERYADDHGLAVVMPQVHRSFYADEAHGAGFLDLPQRRAAAGGVPVLPGVHPARGHLRRRAQHGRLRRVQVGAAGSVALRGRGEPVRAAGH